MNNPIYTIVGNAIRVKLILCLSDGEKTVSELIEKCGLSQSAVSQHLQKLRLCGFVEARKEGREQFYTVLNPKLIEICQKISSFSV